MENPAKDPADVSLKLPFVGIPSFLRAPICTDLAKLDAMIAVMGVPTDEGSPFMGGSRFGPRALREHSLRFASGGAGYYDPETRRDYLVEELRQHDRPDGEGDRPRRPAGGDRRRPRHHLPGGARLPRAVPHPAFRCPH